MRLPSRARGFESRRLRSELLVAQGVFYYSILSVLIREYKSKKEGHYHGMVCKRGGIPGR